MRSKNILERIKYFRKENYKFILINFIKTLEKIQNLM